jgi:general secretion pathway protein K
MRRRGSALVAVLVVVAVAAVLVAAMTAGQGTALRRAAIVIARDRAMELLFGFESWAVVRLERDRAGNAVDNLDEDWAAVMPPVPVGEGSIAGRIVDAQGRINVNDLVLGDDLVRDMTRSRLQRLFGLCGVDPLAMAALEDWLDPDDDPRPMGAEADYYLSLDPPLRPANRPLMDVGQLARLRYMDGEGFRCLAPNLTALPEVVGLNVNTATDYVLASLAAGIAPEDVRGLVPKGGFASVGAFTALPLWKGTGLKAAGLTVASSWFLVYGESVNQEGTWAMESLVHRGERTGVARRRLVPPEKKEDGGEEDDGE